ncbi:hypothetical protein D9M73_170120 [compost metagenome]
MLLVLVLVLVLVLYLSQFLELPWSCAAVAHGISNTEEFAFFARRLLIIDLLAMTAGMLPVEGNHRIHLSIKFDSLNRQMNQTRLLRYSRIFVSIHLHRYLFSSRWHSFAAGALSPGC